MVRILTIDGPSGSGKGTVGQLVATRLGWHYLDSGAIYRALGLAARWHGTPLDASTALATLALGLDLDFAAGRVWLAGRDVSAEMRGEDCGNAASRIAAFAEVRAALLERQRVFAREPGLVADGRDMGSQVFPHAQVKIFLTASPAERAKRRYNQLKEKGFDVSLKNLTIEIEERDRRDAERSVAPLRAPIGALELESTGLSVAEMVARVLREAQRAFPEYAD
jgi:CMP/dCMP kinase